MRCDVNADCFNTIGQFECVCRSGYQGDGFNCTGTIRLLQDLHKSQELLIFFPADINECGLANLQTCGANAICTNTIGSFSCSCSPGYEGDGQTCTGNFC